jgi:hypothetical protein
MTSRRNRRGIALVVVLALLALTLGFSYALLRSHTTDHELERNQSRKTDARAAAQAGIAVALRKLYDGTWAGADTTFTGDLTADKLQGFAVTYTTGDSELTSSSADWSEYPFRVTILSKGYSIDPMTSSSRSEFSIRVVAQLIRRKLNTSLVTTTGLESYSVYQSGDDKARIHYPIRLNGNVHLQGELEFSRSYPQNYLDNTYLTFFGDLQSMYAFNNAWDYRPFSGRLYTPASRQPSSGDVAKVLDAKLLVPRTDVPISSTPPVPTISSFSGYRLYAGGKSYSGQKMTNNPDSQDVVPNAQNLIMPGTYGADPQTNPLGVFLNNQDSVGFTSNTIFKGMLVAYGGGSASDVHIAGSNVTIQGTTLPALSGDSTIYRLSAIIAGDDIHVYDGTNRTIDGWIVCADEFQLEPGAANTTVTVTGGIFCSKLYLDQRTSWTRSYSDWQLAYSSWALAILKTGDNAYFPGWVNNTRSAWGIYLTPRLIFSATPSGVTNHVPDFTQPIYVPHSEDGGLRWDVVKWQEIGAS